MNKAAVKRSVSIGGLSFSETTNLTSDVAVTFDKDVPAAKTGTLTTRTDANTGELTMQASHGITTGVLLDVYWTGGSRRRMTVGTVAGTACPIDGGVGDDLPADETAITAMIPLVEVITLDSDAVAAVFMSSAAIGHVAITESDNTTLLEKYIKAGGVYSLYEGNGETNPLEGADDIGKVFFSHGNSSAEQKMKCALMYN